MKKEIVIRPEIKLVGISARTSYNKELDKMNGNIFPCVKKYFHNALFQKISNRKNPGTTFCVYTDYQSDYRGDYTYFIGEEVTSFKDLQEGFNKLTIPKQTYIKFTAGPDPMPNVIVDAWSSIWNMSPTELGGERSYHTDFEIYDERAHDHQKIILDLYIGIRQGLDNTSTTFF